MDDTEPSQGADLWSRFQADELAFGRFRVGEPLGAGGWGQVDSATDVLTGQTVALKRIAVPTRRHRERAQREIAALKLLQLPGVVRYIDSGTERDTVWIAMERVEGERFPRRAEWAGLRPILVALLRTLAQVHDRDIIHRDLKPSNVLIRPTGEPVLLDFGVARGAALGGELTRVGRTVGTPRYFAPEQLEGLTPDGRTDVYALGVMAYEALTGSLPHSGDEQHLARLIRDPTPAEQRCPTLPAEAARLLRRMLARRPADRPPAGELLRELAAGDGAPPPVWRGGRETLDALLSAVDAGERCCVWGPPGSGVTRLLEAVYRARDGARWATPGALPLESLQGIPELAGAWEAADVQTAVAEGLGRLTGPLLVDDAARLDSWSTALLEEISLPAGCLLVRPGPAAHVPARLTDATLRSWFADPSRFLHLAEDAAAEILRRTDGWVGRVVSLLAAWERDRTITREDGTHHITRETLDRLAAEVVIPPSTVRREQSGGDDLVTAIRLAWPASTIDNLAVVTGRAAWSVRLEAEALVGRGWARWDGERLVPCVEPQTRWPPERQRLARTRLAERLPVGSPGRLAMLLVDAEPAVLVEEMLAQALKLEREGRVGMALSLLWSARELDADSVAVRCELVRVLLSSDSAESIDKAAFVAMMGPPELRDLVEAVGESQLGKFDLAHVALDRVLFWPAPGLKMVGHGIRVFMSRGRPFQEQHELLEDIGADVLIQDDVALLAQLQSWRGMVFFRQQLYREAAQLQEDAALTRSTQLGIVSTLLNAAQSWLQAGFPERARSIAEGAAVRAARCRLPDKEARAHWLVRVVDNLLGAEVLDAALIDELRVMQSDRQLALSAMTEGFIAWRGGHSCAAEIAEVAVTTFRALGNSAGASHASALQWACQPTGQSRGIEEGLCEIVDLHPDITLDGLALLVGGGARVEIPDGVRQTLISAHMGEVSPYRRGARSVPEALRLLFPGG